MEGAISSSPTKSTASPLSIPSGAPAGRRGHAHRRSAAMSINDLKGFTQPAEVQPRLSTSLPTTPMEHIEQPPPLDRAATVPILTTESVDPLESSMDAATRPPSRRVVFFDDNVKIIPRPLSTISSDTEGSLTTVRGHSVNNSISSMLSMGTPSPPHARHVAASLSTTFEFDSKPRTRSSLEISKRLEKEGEWLKSRNSSQTLDRPVSESGAVGPRLTFAAPDSPVKLRTPHNKKHSFSHALGFDRRKSEPAISPKANELSRLSSISLQEDAKRAGLVIDDQASRTLDRKSSTRKIKDWAVSKINRRVKDAKVVSTDASTALPSSQGTDEPSVPGKVPTSEPEQDLDAVFSSQVHVDEPQRLSTPTHPRIEISTPAFSQSSSSQARYSDESSQMVDLDAALGPFKTPSLGGPRQRRELHSSRLAKDFGGPGMHYHRRAESLPTLPAFELTRSAHSQSSMDDVLEEDDGEEVHLPGQYERPINTGPAPTETAGIGIHIVESDISTQGSPFGLGADDLSRVEQDDWESERPLTSYGSVSSRLSTPILERRPSSIVEETIMEESSPIEPLDIVEAHEEPRASSLTKSSDSSETPTLLAAQTGTLAIPDCQQSLMTPETYQTSTFSSPDFSRRQGSFDTSRLGTSASSIADNRTMSSYATGEHAHDLRLSVDEPVPSLTSSRSTMMSTSHANSSRRDFSDERTPSTAPAILDPAIAAERRRKRASIQSLSQLMGGSFSGKSRTAEDSRPHTAAEEVASKPPKKEHRLKKLMFWKSKNQSKQSLHE